MSTSPTSLYLCYQSLLDPLTQTQVVAYLEGLARVGYGVVLVTFEPRPLSEDEEAAWRDKMSRMGVVWYWRRYHKRPTLPATLYDVLVGVLTGVALVRRHQVRLVHARSHVAGVMGMALKRMTGVKLLFDVRGLMAEEYADAGVWPPGGALYRMTRRAERALLRAADGVVVLTHRIHALLEPRYRTEMAGKPLQVIPCCFDFRESPPHRPETSPEEDGPTVVYVGKLGGWYLTEAMVAFVASAAETLPGLRWQVWTQSDPEPLRRLVARYGVEGRTRIGKASPDALKAELTRADAGLSFIKPCVSKLASSPTKVAEYLAAGLPVISTADIGDTDAVLIRGALESNDDPVVESEAVGLLVRGLSDRDYRRAAEELRRLLDDPDTPRRCREVAGRLFDLEMVGWKRYRDLYEELIGRAGPPSDVDDSAGPTAVTSYRLGPSD